MAGRLLDESHVIAAFKQQLGIHIKEEEEFGWIAEVGIQSPLPPRWTAHSDASSGYVYYVDHDRQVSTWENPLVPCLRRIVEIGRNYLKCYTAGYFEEQKGILWHQHKQELDKWHGPFMDDAGRQYFVNSEDGISSWQDPRMDAQYVFELESGLLTSLEEILPPARPDTPNFDPKDGHWKTAEGAEVLTLDSPKETKHIINSAARKTFRERKSRTLTTTAQKNAQAEYRSTMERMSSVAERLRSLQMDDEEAQRLQLLRRAEDRRKRRSGGTAASAPPALAIARIPSLAEDQVRKKPSALDGDVCPRPPLSRQDTLPPPPPPDEVMQEALAPNIAPATSPSCAENFAPPAHPPSPQAGKRPAASLASASLL
ncbi:ITCH [Symbiodinium natans]|uniref:ITCH protein n=1 Tax=Symbiodinium natans TaxID=878477 RepID=A0A812QLM5_9DINO|nr:ITCH [Symbiodinium natans]